MFGFPFLKGSRQPSAKTLSTLGLGAKGDLISDVTACARQHPQFDFIPGYARDFRFRHPPIACMIKSVFGKPEASAAYVVNHDFHRGQNALVRDFDL